MPTKPVAPRRADKPGTYAKGKWNEMRRPRGEDLSKAEVDALYRAAGAVGRHRARDSAMIWFSFVHGLRAAETVGLKLQAYDLRSNLLTVNRVKNGVQSVHPFFPKEKTMLLSLAGERRTGHVFLTEFGDPLSTSSFLKIVARAGELAVDENGERFMNFPVHPHMLRHACGYWLNAQGHNVRAIQEWLGHKDIRNTERYTKNSPAVFKTFTFD
jgi:type 1 fimbriae regulatory protein FimE